MVILVLWVSASRNNKNASASVVPGATWLVAAVAAEGVETGSVALYWASSDARSAGKTGVCGGAGTENSFTEPTCSLATSREEYGRE